MRRLLVAAALTVAAAAASATTPALAQQQGQVPLPPGGFKPPPPPPIKPYKPVAVTRPAHLTTIRLSRLSASSSPISPRTRTARRSPSSSSRRTSSGSRTRTCRQEQSRNRQSGQGDRPRCQGRIRLARPGGICRRADRVELPDQKGVFCAPADPNIDPAAFQALGEATQTDPSDWGYPHQGRPRSARARRQPNAPVIEKLGMTSGARAGRHRAPDNANSRFSCTSRRPPAKPASSRPTRFRRSAATRCAILRMQAAGRSPATSAAPRSSGALLSLDRLRPHMATEQLPPSEGTECSKETGRKMQS